MSSQDSGLKTQDFTPHPWLAHYDSGVPASVAPYPDRTLVDELKDAARDRPNDAAVLFKGSTISYAELDGLSDTFAAALQSLGVKRNDRVALLLPNCPQFLIAQFGAWKIGAIVAPLNPIYTEGELEAPLIDYGATTIVTLTRFYGRVKRIQARTRLRRVIATNIKEYFPLVLRILFTLARERREGDRVALAPGDHDFAHLLLLNRGRLPQAEAPRTDDAAVLLLSGGTTGTPKGVIGTHGAYTRAGRQVVSWVASVLQEEKRPIFVPLPLFHVYCNAGIQPLAFLARLPMALVPNPRDLDDLIATIKKVKPSFFNGVPTLYIALLNHRDVKLGKVDFRSIRICVSGAAPLMADTKRGFESLTGGRIVEAYSLTEAMMAICANPVEGPEKIGSVGMPLPDVEVRIVDGDSGTQAQPANAVGEVTIAAPQLMAGYWNRPDETAAVLRESTEGGITKRWLHTGDLGYLDEDGYLFLVDRMKDLIKTSGYQVWPREIEEILAAHPAVAEVGVAGVPDESKGEVVKAWVVVRKDHPATVDELRAYCRGHLAPYKVPATIELRTELPKTMVGKVLRRALKS